jgi:hypothetical protein
MLISPALALMRQSGPLQRNVDLSAPENQSPIQGAGPGGWQRGPTPPGRTRHLEQGLAEWALEAAWDQHTAFPRVHAWAAQNRTRSEGKGRLGAFVAVCTSPRQEADAQTALVRLLLKFSEPIRSDPG